MKGIIFTEFLDLVEDKFGLEMADKIITASNFRVRRSIYCYWNL